MTRKTKAILMNALMLPGMGQLYLGRKLQGVVLIVLVNVLLLAAFFVLLKSASPLIAASLSAGSVSAAELQASLDAVSGLAKGVIAIFFALWGFALYDLVKNGREEQSNSGN